MFQNFEDFQKISKDNAELALKNFNTVSKSFQTIAVEVADYQKKSFEQGTAALERLFSARSIDKAVETQTDYFKTAYEGFVAQSKKIGEIYADLAKETYKPVETAFANANVKAKQ
jgi:phasin family protein